MERTEYPLEDFIWTEINNGVPKWLSRSLPCGKKCFSSIAKY
jgi:hypothetical protein